MTESIGQPAYQQVADDLRRKIASADFPVGSAIPSTARLTELYGVSSTVIRAAVGQLRADGLLIGQPGKGVFVRATPEAAAERAATIEDLSRQLDEFRAELRRVESARREETAAEIAALRLDAGLLRRHLVDLYAQLGKPYPDDGASVPAVE
ncbi:MAG TPA: GntR family transcriptional regulator [Streptosporangiaceae bacterium]|nr:GntR family transcriptional regulator [Streptosporangiaceae bacterium]